MGLSAQRSAPSKGPIVKDSASCNSRHPRYRRPKSDRALAIWYLVAASCDFCGEDQSSDRLLISDCDHTVMICEQRALTGLSRLLAQATTGNRHCLYVRSAPESRLNPDIAQCPGCARLGHGHNLFENLVGAGKQRGRYR
jgi:hypothetical protein